MHVQQTHRDLAAWQAALALAGKVYEATTDLPRDEHLGLGNRLRTSAAAVVTRIAEGAAHHDRQNFMACLRQARSSLAELETLLFIAERQLATPLFAGPLQDVRRVDQLVSALSRKLSEQRATAHHFRTVLPTSDIKQVR